MFVFNKNLTPFLRGIKFFSAHKAPKNPYDVLEISPNSTLNEIKNAYLKLSKTYHPDLNKSPDAEEKFKQINNVFRIKILLDKLDKISTKKPNLHFFL